MKNILQADEDSIIIIIIIFFTLLELPLGSMQRHLSRVILQGKTMRLPSGARPAAGRKPHASAILAPGALLYQNFRRAQVDVSVDATVFAIVVLSPGSGAVPASRFRVLVRVLSNVLDRARAYLGQVLP